MAMLFLSFSGPCRVDPRPPRCWSRLYTGPGAWKPQMTVDYRSLFVRVQRGVPNHMTPIHTVDPRRIASTGSHDTSSYCSIRSPGRRSMYVRRTMYSLVLLELRIYINHCCCTIATLSMMTMLVMLS